MWLSAKIYDLFTLSASQRVEYSALKIERDALVRELAEAKANFKWMTLQVNQLQLERQALLEKVYNVKVASPIILTQPNTVPDFNQDIFTDLDEVAAKGAVIVDNLPKWGN